MKSSNGLYEVEVVIRGRTAATEVVHNGTTYIEGRKGTEYTLRFKNRSNRKVLFLPSVDGLSVLDGKEAGLKSPGYVVDPYHSFEIPGWKVDSRTAAKFVFAEKGSRSSDPAKRTYAEQLGTNPKNIGVIGIAVFPEKIKEPPPVKIVKEYVPMPYPVPSPTPPWRPYNPWGTDPYRVTYGSNSGDVLNNSINQTEDFFSARASAVGSTETMDNWSEQGLNRSLARESKTSGGIIGARSLRSDVRSLVPESEPSVGTGFGEATTFNTREVTFERANETVPDAVMTLIYDTILNLEQMGVPVDQFRPNRPSANREAFPASPELSSSNCPTPPGWTRRRRR